MGGPSYDLKWDPKLPLAWYRMTGLWDQATQQAWEKYVGEFVKGHPGGKWYAIGDLTEFPAQHDFVNNARRRLLDLLVDNGCTHVAIIVPKAIIKMQTMRVARDTTDAQRFSVVASVDEALSLLGLPRTPSPFGAPAQ